MQKSEVSQIKELLDKFDSYSVGIQELISQNESLNHQQIDAFRDFYAKRQLILDKIKLLFIPKVFSEIDDAEKTKLDEHIKMIIKADSDRLFQFKEKLNKLKSELVDLQKNKSVLKYK